MRTKMRVRSLILASMAVALTSLGLLLFSAADGIAKASSQEKVVLVGLDSMKHSVSTEIPAEEYRKELAKAFGSVNDSIVPALRRKANEMNSKSNGMHLNAVGVGIGISGTIGLGPIVSITPSAQIRLVFTNSKSPIYPN